MKKFLEGVGQDYYANEARSASTSSFSQALCRR